MNEKNEFEKFATKHIGIGSLNLHRYNAMMEKNRININPIF